MKDFRKNPQWSFSCCLALQLPLNDLQGEIRGLAGRDILMQQLHNGKMDMPSVSGAVTENQAVNFDLETIDDTEVNEERDLDNTTGKGEMRVKECVLTFANISIHELPSGAHQKQS